MAKDTTGEAAPAKQPQCLEHSGIVATLDDHERRLKDGKERMERIEETVNDIRDRLLGRPSWIVVSLMTFMACAIGVLGTVCAILHTGRAAIPPVIGG